MGPDCRYVNCKPPMAADPSGVMRNSVTKESRNSGPPLIITSTVVVPPAVTDAFPIEMVKPAWAVVAVRSATTALKMTERRNMAIHRKEGLGWYEERSRGGD